MNQTFCNDAARIFALVKQDRVFEQALHASRKEDDFRRSHFADDLSLLSGWGHDFCCPDCASQLVYEHERPKEYRCPNCGRKASGLVLDEAWAYYTRHQSGEALASSALCYLADGNAASLDYVIRYVDFYANHYESLPVHGEHAGKGKVMGQSLDEAVWALQLLKALNICGRDAFPAETRKRWMERMFRPMSELLMPQAQFIHNIPLWLWCAVGAMAIFFEDEALLVHALENEYGIRAQVSKGFTADGLWYECSLGYHYYSARALTMFLSFYTERHQDDELFNVLRKVLEVPAELSADGIQLPAVNDGWYPLAVDKEQDTILRASRISDSPILQSQLSGMFNRHPERFEAADALLFLNEIPASSPLPQRNAFKAYPATALGVLYQPMHVLMKCGVLTLSHMHDDCMSISLPPFSDDLGTPGYGHPLTDRYYRRSLAHNTFMMDEQSQPHTPIWGQVEEIGDGIRGFVKNIYDGVNCTRTVTGDEKIVIDEMIIEANDVHTFDWVFRAAGRCKLTDEGSPAALSYDMLSSVRQHKGLSSFEAVYELDGRGLIVAIDPETLKKAEVYTGQLPGNPADQLQNTILMRMRGKQVRFLVRYKQF